MAFVLLAIGALMSGAGIYAVVSGYSIIQVEEGWASVISGATLIAGGIVTVGLALVLRAVNEVKAVFQASPAAILSQAASVAGPPSPPLEVPPPTFGTARDRDHGNVEPPIATKAPALAETLEDPPAPMHPPEPEPGRAHDVPSGDTPEDAPRAPADPEPPFAAPRAADDYKLETPSTAEHDLMPLDLHVPAREPSPAPVRQIQPLTPAPMDDWLDRAFAELDRDSPPLPRRAEQEPRKPILEPAAALPPSQSAIAAPEPPPVVQDAGQPELPPAEPQASAPATSAVIGRYESEGTMYVMYADGSIEAQSAAGVYRFASMAELKAFIET